MNRGAKIALGLAMVGGVTALVALSGKSAKAATLPPVGPPLPESQDEGTHPADGVVVVPTVPSVPVGSDPHPADPVVVAPSSPPIPSLPVVPPVINVPIGNGQTVPVAVPPLPTSLPPIPMVFDPRLPRNAPQEQPPLVISANDGSPPLVVPPITSAASAVPGDTARLVARLLREEATGKWKHKDAETGAWQKARGMKDDGELGPGTALRMAQEIGSLPIVRYWPKGSYKEGKWLREYQQALIALANSAPEPRASQLRVAADRERGQGFGSQQLPIGVRIELS